MAARKGRLFFSRVYVDALWTSIDFTAFDLEYATRQYTGAPSSGTSITRNQQICFTAPVSSKRKRKTSIAETLLTYAKIPAIRSGGANGPSQAGVPGVKQPARIPAVTIRDIQAASR